MPPAEVTTIIATYRRPRLLERAVRSALGQSFRNLRVLVLDNDSEDQTPEVVAALAREDPRVFYHRHPRNVGLYDNFRFGLDAVETPYFSFLSDDDWLLPRFYERALASLKEHPRARFFCGRSWHHHLTHNTRRLEPARGWQEGLYRAGEAVPAMLERPFTWTASLFSTEIRPHVVPFEKIPTFDVLFLAKAAARFDFLVSGMACAVFSVGRSGITRSLPPDEWKAIYQTMLRRCQELSLLSDMDSERTKRFFHRKVIEIGNGLLRQAFREEAWSSFEESASFLRKEAGIRCGTRIYCALARSTRWSSLPYKTFRRLANVRHATRNPRASPHTT
jgi:glycosyltransferase involved in cell wall biosynthesis